MGADSDEEELASMRASKRGAVASSGHGGPHRVDADALRERQARLEREQDERQRHLLGGSGHLARNSSAGQGEPGHREGNGAVEGEDDGDADSEDGGGNVGGMQASNGRAGAGPIPGMAVEDDAELDIGFRAAFPKTFGKQEEKPEAPLEFKHEATKRKEALAGAKKGATGKGGKGGMTFKIGGALRLGGSSVPPPKREPEKMNSGQIEGPLVGPPAPLPAVPGDERESGLAGPPAPPAGPTTTGNEEAASAGLRPPKSDTAGEDGFVGPPRPPSGAAARGLQDGDGDGGFVGPPRPGQQGNGAQDGEEEDDEGEGGGEEEEEDEDEFRVPVSNEVVLQGHTKVVSALAVDPTGSRVITGSYDYTVRMYDFGGMDSRLKAFRELSPFDGHQVRALTWSPTADLFFCATGNAQAKVYDRDGRTKGEFVRGDMYIRDMRNTSGHLSGLTAAEWHPSKRHTVVSASEDGSVRIWDVTNFKKQVQVVKPKLARPGRVPVTAVKWGPGGGTLAAGLNDGSLQVWNVKAGWGSRPDLFLDAAHAREEDISGLLFSGDGSMLLSRSTDGTMKVWDVRKFKAPIKVFDDLPNHYAQTNIAWSPDERLFLTGTSSEKGGRSSEIVFFDREKLEVARRTGMSETQSVVRVEWHPRLNQIFATAGDKKAGGTHILYDPTLSERGALMCVARAPRKPRPEDMCTSVMAPAIHNPHALPLFRDEPSRKRQREKARKDPVQSKRPDLPVEGVGHGGRLGVVKGTLLTQYLLREGGLLKETWMEEDPREAILKYAEVAEKDPQIVAPAYAATQPKPMFYESDEEKEEE